MKKNLFFLLVFLSIVNLYSIESNFRNLYWGMSIEEVLKAEPEIIKSDVENIYRSTDYLFDNEFLVFFVFEDNKLIKGEYLLMFESENFKYKLSLVDKLYNLLNNKYGINNVKNVDFEMFLLDREKMLQRGYCDLECKWECNNTAISLQHISIKNSSHSKSNGHLRLIYKFSKQAETVIESEEDISVGIGYLDKNGFRNSTWGMNLNEVKKNEGLDVFVENDNILIYSHSFLGMPCEISYFFDSNRLNCGMYSFSPNISNSKSIILDFLRIKDELIKQYNLPNSDKSQNIGYYKDKTKYELLSMIKENDFECIWVDKNSEIKLRLSEDSDSDFSIILIYSNLSKDQELYEETKKKL